MYFRNLFLRYLTKKVISFRIYSSLNIDIHDIEDINVGDIEILLQPQNYGHIYQNLFVTVILF